MSTAAATAVAAAEPTGATSPAPRPLTSPQLLPTCVPRAVSDPVSATSTPAVPNTVTAVSPPALAPPSPSAAQDRPNLKRKTPPSVSPGLDADADADAEAEDDDEEEEDRKPLILAPGSPVPSSRRECSSVICKACGVVVRIGEMWDTHRGTCAGTARPAHSHTHSHSNLHAHPQPYPHPHQQQHRHHHPAQYAPPPPPPLPAVETTSYTSILSGLPPAKRRRAKRTEDERIAYLRADTHVAQFEAYRVLCASCDKWIRLRPNSTYCSIPWDAHRKSCLAKKSHAKNAHAYALDERNAAFAKDPDVRKFDAERLLCGVCDKWIALPVDDHLGAVQMWVQHRDGCRKSVGAGMRGVGVMTSNVRGGMVDRDGADDECKPPQSPPSAAARSRTPPASSTSSRKHPYSPPPPPPAPAPFPAPLHLPLPDAPHVVLDLSPANYAAPHESRRRNAEQRAATLRADVLIREVEPNRVFCSLCTKWVQLRQDSSYCAYPWLQHRGKCLARYQRRAQKAGTEGAKSNGGASKTRYSEEEKDECASELDDAARHAHRRRGPAPLPAHPPRHLPPGYISAPARESGAQDGDADADAEGEDVDADGDSYMEDESASAVAPGRVYTAPQQIRRPPVRASLADLDSPAGRRQFISISIEYLFHTTHEASDDLSISALLGYLNAAMPIDKHEDFDFTEVTRVATAFVAREGRFVLEGDRLRIRE